MKKPSLIRRFFSFLFKLCVVIVLMAVIAVASFEGVTYYLTGSFRNIIEVVREELGDTITEETGTSTDTTTEVDSENIESSLIFVNDSDEGTIYMALNMYDNETNALDIVLVPANAQVTVGSTLLKEIQETMSDASSSLNMEDMFRNFGDEKYEMAEKILEEVCGIDISGYDLFSKDDFIKMLDSAGTVTYSLDNAISYRDEEGTLQTIEEGEQNLDGETAFALITYLDGSDSQESDRLEVAAAYLKSFCTELLAQNNDAGIAEKYDSLVTSNKESGLSGTEDVLSSLTDDAVTIRIMQGSESGGVFTLDSQKVQLQITSLIQQAEAYSESSSTGSDSTVSGDSSTDTADTTGSSTDSSEYSIELYNAAYVSGLAAEWQSYLEGEGYTISLVDSYQDEGPISQTRINVTEEGMGEDLLTFFPDAEINVVDEISTGGDIQVYIGTDSTDVPESSGTATTDTEDETDTEDDTYSYDTDGYSYDTDSYSYDTDSE